MKGPRVSKAGAPRRTGASRTPLDGKIAVELAGTVRFCTPVFAEGCCLPVKNGLAVSSWGVGRAGVRVRFHYGRRECRTGRAGGAGWDPAGCRRVGDAGAESGRPGRGQPRLGSLCPWR
jgi:hypothetical protein